ncbi:MAG: hypothetical protein Kow00129_06220 [Thermoleophilia bacterium]
MLIALFGAVSGCTENSAETSMNAMEREYFRLHGTTPRDVLAPGGIGLEEAMSRIQLGTHRGVPVLAPTWLPSRMQVAAPFRGTGSGAGLPNPHLWGSGWALTLTDGYSRLTVVAGAEDEFAGSWETLRMDSGRELGIQRKGELTLVRVECGGDQVIVVGERLAGSQVVRVADSLREQQRTERSTE